MREVPPFVLNGWRGERVFTGERSSHDRVFMPLSKVQKLIQIVTQIVTLSSENGGIWDFEGEPGRFLSH